MRKMVFPAIIAIAVAIGATFGGVIMRDVSSYTYAATIPCEDMLKDLRTAEAAATLGDADKAKVADLESKGVERCNADDDKRADDFFSQAMKVLGK